MLVMQDFDGVTVEDCGNRSEMVLYKGMRGFQNLR